MSAEQLPTVGLAEFYLASTPLRDSNQCALASLVIQMVIRNLGLQAEPVALLLDVDTPQGRARYGTDRPRMEGGKVVGHVGLIADGFFIDPTAAQFPEIVRHGGARVLAGHLRGQDQEVLRRGANVPIRLLDKHIVQYHVLPEGSADGVLLQMMSTESNRQGLAKMSVNAQNPYLKVLSEQPFLERVQTLTAPRYATFVHAVKSMRNKKVLMVDDVFQVQG